MPQAGGVQLHLWGRAVQQGCKCCEHPRCVQYKMNDALGGKMGLCLRPAMHFYSALASCGVAGRFCTCTRPSRPPTHTSPECPSHPTSLGYRAHHHAYHPPLLLPRHVLWRSHTHTHTRMPTHARLLTLSPPITTHQAPCASSWAWCWCRCVPPCSSATEMCCAMAGRPGAVVAAAACCALQQRGREGAAAAALQAAGATRLLLARLKHSILLQMVGVWAAAAAVVHQGEGLR